MEQYRSANSISLHDHASFAQRNVTQIPQNTARVLDKVRARPIIVRSFVRVTYAQNTKSVKQLNNRGRTNPLRKKVSSKHSPADAALCLCRILFVAELRKPLPASLPDMRFFQPAHTTRTGQEYCLRAFFLYTKPFKRRSI